jgi:hypothetical protein
MLFNMLLYDCPNNVIVKMELAIDFLKQNV